MIVDDIYLELAKIVLLQNKRFTPDDIYLQLGNKNINYKIIKEYLKSLRDCRILIQVDLNEVYKLNEQE